MCEQFKVSIVIVCLNARDHFECTINSVFSQTYQNIEKIVIDGGSKDGTIEEVNKYKDRLDVFISEPDDGIYDAMNKGISYASGDIIYFLNCGDYLSDKEIISKVVNIFLKNPNSHIVYGDTIEYNFSGVQIYKKNFKESVVHLITQCGIYHQAIFAKRELFQFKDKKAFDTKYKMFSDQNWLLDSVLKTETKLIYIDIPVNYYLMGGFSQLKYRDYSAEKLHIIFKNARKLLNLKLIIKYPKEYAYLSVLILWLFAHSIRAFILRL